MKPHYVAISGFVILFLVVIVWYFFFSGKKEGFYQNQPNDSFINDCPPCDMLTACRNFLLKNNTTLLTHADLQVEHFVTRFKFRDEVAGYPRVKEYNNGDVTGCVEYELSQCKDDISNCDNILKCNPYKSGDEKDATDILLTTYRKNINEIRKDLNNVQFDPSKLDKKLRDIYQMYFELSIEKETGKRIV